MCVNANNAVPSQRKACIAFERRKSRPKAIFQYIPISLVESSHDQGLNIFPVVESVDAKDVGREVEVIFLTKIEGQLKPVVVKLSYRQAADLSKLLAIFGK